MHVVRFSIVRADQHLQLCRDAVAFVGDGQQQPEAWAQPEYACAQRQWCAHSTSSSTLVCVGIIIGDKQQPQQLVYVQPSAIVHICASGMLLRPRELFARPMGLSSSSRSNNAPRHQSRRGHTHGQSLAAASQGRAEMCGACRQPALEQPQAAV